MVVFTCGQCNESLKKNQVEKHYQSRCRNCDMLSCVDCGKDFWGDTYKEHIKCITEEEKYSGKNYKPKPNANKGEVKQELWLEKVQTAIDGCVTNSNLKILLERMKDYPNIPRKKAKFENFVSNSMNIRDKRLASEAWDLLLENAASNDKVADKAATNGESNNDASEQSESSGVKKEQLKELSKQERKAERKRVKNAEDKESESDNKNVEMDKNGMHSKVSDKQSNKKKAKKRKRKDTDENDDDDVTSKRQHTDESEPDGALNTTEDTDNVNIRVKFNWEETITTVLKSRGEITLKKLKKKVLCEYQAQGCNPKTEDKLMAKLNKKIMKNPSFVIKKERVKLKISK